MLGYKATIWQMHQSLSLVAGMTIEGTDTRSLSTRREGQMLERGSFWVRNKALQSDRAFVGLFFHSHHRANWNKKHNSGFESSSVFHAFVSLGKLLNLSKKCSFFLREMIMVIPTLENSCRDWRNPSQWVPNCVSFQMGIPFHSKHVCFHMT